MLKYDTINSGPSWTKKIENLGEVSKAIPLQAMKAYGGGVCVCVCVCGSCIVQIFNLGTGQQICKKGI